MGKHDAHGLMRNPAEQFFQFQVQGIRQLRIILQDEHPVLRAGGSLLNGAAHDLLAPGHAADVFRSLSEPCYAIRFPIIPFFRRNIFHGGDAHAIHPFPGKPLNMSLRRGSQQILQVIRKMPMSFPGLQPMTV